MKLTWHDAGKRPPILAELKLEVFTEGILFVGKGKQLVANYTKHRLLPVKAFEGLCAGGDDRGVGRALQGVGERTPGRASASAICQL